MEPGPLAVTLPALTVAVNPTRCSVNPPNRGTTSGVVRLAPVSTNVQSPDAPVICRLPPGADVSRRARPVPSEDGTNALARKAPFSASASACNSALLGMARPHEAGAGGVGAERLPAVSTATTRYQDAGLPCGSCQVTQRFGGGAELGRRGPSAGNVGAAR